MSKPVEFWFEFASTYSYPAAMRVEAEAHVRHITVQWKPFLLGPVFQAMGWKDSPFNIYPAKGRYMWRDLERTCAALKLPFVRQSTFPRGSILAARVVASNMDAPWVPAFVRAVYTANFGDDWDVANPEVIAAILTAQHLDAPALIAAASADTAKSALRHLTDTAIAKGIFGAPSIIVGDDLFWGNDRLEQALDWAGRA